MKRKPLLFWDENYDVQGLFCNMNRVDFSGHEDLKQKPIQLLPV